MRVKWWGRSNAARFAPSDRWPGKTPGRKRSLQFSVLAMIVPWVLLSGASAAQDQKPHTKEATPSEFPSPDGVDDADFRLFCDCDDIKKPLEDKIERQEAEIARLETAERTFKSSFELVTLKWLKAALYYRGKYDGVEVEGSLLNDIVPSPIYDKYTVEAAKNYQCEFHGDASCDTIGDTQATGWLTYVEARDLMCRAAHDVADPDLSIIVASWFAEGRVYTQNLPHAKFLVKKVLSDVRGKLKPGLPSEQRNRLVQFRSEAQILDRLIDANARASETPIEFPDIDVTADQLCAWREQDINFNAAGGGR